MKFIPGLCIVLSFTMLAGARPAISNRTLRIPLERRSRNAIELLSAQSVTNEQFLGADRAERLVSYTHKKYEATFAAYERNTGSRHPLDTLAKSSSTSPSKRAATGKVDLVNYQSEMFYGDFSIGTPPQPFSAIFDTGSSDILVPDEDCFLTCDGHEHYDASKSSTSRSKLRPTAPIYGSGAALVTKVYNDIVKVAEYTINQTVAAADFLSYQFSKDGMPLIGGEFPPDGLFGCAFGKISAINATSPVENLNNSKQLPESYLSFMLSDIPGRSELIIGDANYSAFKSDTLVWAPVTDEGYWQIKLGDLRRPDQVSGSINCSAIVDTGTTLIVVPTAVANNYFSGVSGARCTTNGLCIVPCDTINSTTPTLTIEGRDFPVCPSIWNFGPDAPGSSNCITGMGTSDFEFVIVGDVFMRNFYSIFDFWRLNVGFADLVDPVC